ncbi:MAG: sulfatase-like hydrolase/transferase [Verrucomicrobiota bacterium]
MKLPLLLFLTLVLPCSGAPNILLILTDDHGWSQVSKEMDPRTPESFSGYLETPNLVRLMDEGMRFTSGYSPAPLCTPTRRSILCGTSAARSGTEFQSPKWIPAEHLTIPKALKAANGEYRCAHFGKWGEHMISTPEECGYDASDGMTGNGTGGMPNTLGIKGGHEDGPPHFIDNDDPKLTRSMTDRAIAFMKEQAEADKPFYVQASYKAQHLTVVTSEDTLVQYLEKGTPDRAYTKAWAAMMEELDQGVGRLLDAIEELDLDGETYVFFTADNGGRGTVPGGKEDGGQLPPNFPLTGAKHSLLEGGIRVPFLARGPGIEPGSLSHVPVVGYDFLTTFQDLAGGQPDALSSEIDGVSIAPLFAEPNAKLDRSQEALFFHRPRRLISTARQGDYKLILSWNTSGEVASREFYDVGENPRELEERNLIEQEPEQAKALETRLLNHLAEVQAEKVMDAPKKKPKKKK